jgi:hypothetical protein
MLTKKYNSVSLSIPWGIENEIRVAKALEVGIRMLKQLQLFNRINFCKKMNNLKKKDILLKNLEFVFRSYHSDEKM